LDFGKCNFKTFEKIGRGKNIDEQQFAKKGFRACAGQG
jgi:hypothetical protein